MELLPEFFLSAAGEYEPLAAPRACWQRTRLRDDIRDDHMLVQIEPVLSGQCFGLLETDIQYLIISSRHQGETLYPVSEWPSFVYVARILDDTVFKTRVFTNRQVELIAWGTLFRVREEAENHARRFQR